jgi:hypothetical protein
MSDFVFILIVTLLFCIYVEYSVGGIFFRQTSLGTIGLNIHSGLSYLLNPLCHRDLWTLSLLDVNYIFVLGVSFFFYKIQ